MPIDTVRRTVQAAHPNPPNGVTDDQWRVEGSHETRAMSSMRERVMVRHQRRRCCPVRANARSRAHRLAAMWTTD